MKAIIFLLAFIIAVGAFATWVYNRITKEDRDAEKIRHQRLLNKEYLTDPTVCRGCGHKHPMVEEIGICGSCASKLYGDSPYLNEM
nr:hypothetical protein [uncultured Draconibacterium sp.]